MLFVNKFANYTETPVSHTRQYYGLFCVPSSIPIQRLNLDVRSVRAQKKNPVFLHSPTVYTTLFQQISNRGRILAGITGQREGEEEGDGGVAVSEVALAICVPVRPWILWAEPLKEH